MKVRMFLATGCSEFREGTGTLTDEHSACSYQQPVWVWDDGDIAGPGDLRGYYLHRLDGEVYLPEQEAWVSDLVVAAHSDPEPANYQQYFRFGATWKTADQLRRIEAARGARLYRNA